MHRRAALLIVLLTAASCLTAGAATIARSTLENGLAVVAVENDSTQVAGIALLIKSSALDETEYGLGSRAILQQLILSAGQEQFEGLAEVASASANHQPRFEVHTDYELLEARLSVEVSELPAGLARLRALVFEPAITEDALKAARELVHQGYDASHRSPVQTTYELFRRAFYQTGPMAGPLQGDHHDLDRVTLPTLQTLHAEQYLAANAVLAVVAPMPVNESTGAVTAAFSSLPRQQPQADPEPAPLPEESVVEVAGSVDLAQASMVLGVPVAAPTDPDYLVGELLAQLLDGPGGRLRRDLGLLQALGLVIPSRMLAEHYPVQALPIPLTRRPYLAVHVLCSPTTIERTRRGVLRHFLAFRTGSASDAEMELARKRLINQQSLEYLRPVNAALRLAQREAMGLPLLSDAEFAAAVAAITKEDLTSFANKYFTRHAIGLQMPEM